MKYIKAGRVTHYFDRIGVAVIEVSDNQIAIGDIVRFGDKDGNEQKVESIQVDHSQVDKGSVGDEIAMKVNQAVRPNETVYIVE